MKRNIRSLAVLCGAIALFVAGAQVRAAEKVIEVVNVNCGGHKWEPVSTMKGRPNPTDRAVAPVAYPGSTWSDGFGWNRDRLKNSENKTTAVSFHVTRHPNTGFAQDWKANKLALLKGGWIVQREAQPLEISGLDIFHKYDLYLPSQDSYGRNRGGSFSTTNVSDTGTKTLVSTGKNLNGATWVEGENYVVFRNVAPSKQGGISIHYKGILNGFQLVRKEPRPPTTISLARTAGAASSNFGDPVTFTAAVGGIKPTGKVIFFDGETPLATKVVSGAFKASITAHVFTGGKHRLTARYAGDAKNAPSISAPLVQSVTDKRPSTTTTLTLGGGTKAPTHGDLVTFTVTAAGAKPTGKVIFHDYDGKMVTPVSYYDSRYGEKSLGSNDLPPIGAAALNAAFKASVATKSLACGRHSITARYVGDMNNSPSTTAPVILNVKPRPGNGKLKIFILSGQSNMEGHGTIEWGGNPDDDRRKPPVIGGLGSLRGMVVNNPDRYAYLLEPKHRVTKSGEKKPPRFASRRDVWISYWNRLGKDPAGEVKNGPLTTGFGASGGSIGPEYGFGQIIGNAISDPVLIIKVAWGGKSLAKDFRPPSSGGTVGKYYTLMVEKVHEVLKNLKKYYPEYKGKGCEIVGFGWHQGWNDRIDEKRTAEYEANLVNLIKDVRAEFKAPKMPFVVATTGMSKANIEPGARKLIAAQTSVSDPDKYPGFAGNVATVDTRPFDCGENSRSPGGGYHWNSNGESYFHIGEQMGLAMMGLLTRSAHAEVTLNGIFTDHMVLQRDIPVSVYGRAAPGEKVSVSFASQKKSATAAKDGRWMVKLDAMKAAKKSAAMTVAGKNKLTLTDIVVGDVWVCSGQSNMGFAMGAYGSPYVPKHFDLPLVRQFHVSSPPSMSLKTSVKGNTHGNKSGNWLVCSPKTGNRFCAVGVYFARKVHMETGIPIGVIKAAWGGTRIEPWITPEGWASVSEIPPVGKLPATYKINPYPSTPHCLYNSWIHPLTRFAIKGALWYQGESNGNEGISYFHKKRALIGGWRKAWNQGDFPFYFVQLAAFQRPTDKPAGGGWAPVRMAQLKSLSIPNTGMAVAIDIDDVGKPDNIHPWDKKSVGERLALWALARDYGKKDLVCSGPLYKSMKVKGNKIVISFDSVGSGLMIASRAGGFEPLVKDPKGKLKRFAIAGADKKWFWANAVIDGKTVVVSSPDVPKPVAVRYAFEMNPEGSNLYNNEGLPASPFCTDDWMMK